MTEIDSEHRGLLLAIAKNTNDKPAQRAYADWLQERGNAGWLIVLNYKIQEWPVWEKGTKDDSWRSYWRLPWLTGRIPYQSISHHLRRMKYILTEYAEGRVE